MYALWDTGLPMVAASLQPLLQQAMKFFIFRGT
jgi:hypothetical protein